MYIILCKYTYTYMCKNLIYFYTCKYIRKIETCKSMKEFILCVRVCTSVIDLKCLDHIFFAPPSHIPRSSSLKEYYVPICACMHACVRACVRACARAVGNGFGVSRPYPFLAHYYSIWALTLTLTLP